MPRVYGQEFPERPLMGTLSDLLGITHFTTSRGSTVRRDFLEAIGRALGIPEATISALDKDALLSAVVEKATQRTMDPLLLSPGATVTNEALQAIIDGLTFNGVPGRPSIAGATPGSKRDISYVDLEFDPEMFKDERDRRLMQIAVREGQDRFRTALLSAYDSRCAITGYNATETLEAAHIYPYNGPASNTVSNGLLLRADLHALFDRGAIAVHETSHRILVKQHLMVTDYSGLAGCHLRLPRLLANRPSTAALRSHREWAGLV